MSEPTTARDSFWMRIIYILSMLVLGAVAFLILGPRPEGTGGGVDVSMLPGVNASLNGLTTGLLLIGVVLIKQGRIPAHRAVMMSAFATSSAFLVTYVIYHWFKAGPKAYEGEFEMLYLFILVTHILLAMAIIPLVLITLYRGWQMDRVRHRRIARITFPLWLYVSVTGVVIYRMLY